MTTEPTPAAAGTAAAIDPNAAAAAAAAPVENAEELTDEQAAKLWAEMEAADAAAAKGTAEPVDSFAEAMKNVTDEPPAPAAAAAPAQEAAAAAPPAKPDVWATAPAELREEHERTLKALEKATDDHSRRSIEGRIRSQQRRLEERRSAAAQQPDTSQEVDAAKLLKEMAAEFPEIAAPIVPLAEKISKIEAVEKSRQEAADAQLDRDLEANDAAVEAKHPGWVEYLGKNGEEFLKWVDDQPAAMRRVFHNNRTEILDPEGAIRMLDAFKQAHEPTPEPAPVVTPPAPTPPLSSRRAAQLAASASPSSAVGAPRPTGMPEEGDSEAMWKYMVENDPDEQKLRKRA